jgi:hypothetical protein
VKKVVEIYEKRQKRRQWIGLFERGTRRPVIEERYAEVEVWERLCCKSFEEDIDDHIGIEEIRVELVAATKVSILSYQDEYVELTASG